MRIKIVGSGIEKDNLLLRTTEVLSELGLSDTVPLDETDDIKYKTDLNITENPAFCVEEENIDFRDVIFQGIIPEKTEILSLIISIVGGEESGSSCETSGCDGCAIETVCH